MDYFNLETTLKYIEKKDKKIISSFEEKLLESDDLSKHSDSLLQVLNYSPKCNKLKKSEIQNMAQIKIPQLSELDLLQDINNRISIKENGSLMNKDDKLHDIKDIVSYIINNALKKITSKEEENDEEELENIINKNKKEIEEEEKKRDTEFTATAFRMGMENLLNELKVYLFDKNKYIFIKICPKEKSKSIKEKIIKKILEEKIIEIKSDSPDDYEIKIINEEDKDKFIISSNTIENKDSLFKDKIKAIIFLENKNYINENLNIKEEIIKISEEKIKLKIHYKNNNNNETKEILISKGDNLKNVLNIFYDEKILKNKNINQQFFVNHNSLQDIENGIDLNTNIQLLTSYELNLCSKDDNNETINEYNVEIKKDFFDLDNENKMNDNNGISRYNEITGCLYQEYEVLKIDKYNIKKNRILGIDMDYLYNNYPKKKNSTIINVLNKETKNPLRKIENIKSCAPIGENGFNINIKKEDKNEYDILCYEAKNTETRDEIVDKINFLIQYVHK